MRTAIENIEYLTENLSGETKESRSLITQLEIAKEFVGFGGTWESAPLELLADGEWRKFFASPAEIITWYGSDEAQQLLDADYKFSTQLGMDGRWATTVKTKSLDDLAVEAEIDATEAR
jgi:hypothetical protein